MMQHHPHRSMNQISRDSNRMSQQCMVPNQQRGPPIMLGVAGSSTVPTPGMIVQIPTGAMQQGGHSGQIQHQPHQQHMSQYQQQQAHVPLNSAQHSISNNNMSVSAVNGVNLLHSATGPNVDKYEVLNKNSFHQDASYQKQHQCNTQPQSTRPQTISINHSNKITSIKQKSANYKPIQVNAVNYNLTPAQTHLDNSSLNPHQVTTDQNSTTTSGLGSLSPSTSAPTSEATNNLSNSSVSNNGSVSTSTYNLSNSDKTPMCLVNELARCNRIQAQYKLTGETGPAHKKLFTVTLTLNEEEYVGKGATIKKAQHSAAALALEQTKFNHPPPRPREPSNRITPGIELNALAKRRGEKITYRIDLKNYPIPPTGVSSPNQPNQYNPQNQRINAYYATPKFNNFDNRRVNGKYGGAVNSSVPVAPYNQGYRMNYDQPPPRGYTHRPNYAANGMVRGTPVTVTVRVGNREFKGEGFNLQWARRVAAQSALDEIRKLPLPDDAPVPEPIDDAINTDLKSPISIVYEIALKRNLPVSFDVKSEKGLPHVKSFTTTCKVGEFVTEGEGNGKKISKKRAAETMLEQLVKLPPITGEIIPQDRFKRRLNGVNKKRTKSIIKETTEEMKPNEVDPISRLIQIQQSRKEKPPVYYIVDERGVPRKKEFTMEVCVGEMRTSGSGRNKKLAKRAASENMLVKLGYARTPEEDNTNATDNSTNPPSTTEKISTAINGDANGNVGERVIDKSVSINGNGDGKKVKFAEDKQPGATSASSNNQAKTTSSNPVVGSSGGRQLAPGLLLMNTSPVPTNNNYVKTTLAPTSTNVAISTCTATPATSTTASSKTSTSQAKSLMHRSKDQLMYLSQLFGFEVQFSDFPKANHEEFLTLLSLSTDPPQVYHGAGCTTEESHEQAAMTALRKLSELGLDHCSSKRD